jgi:hypothetical protein
MSKDFSISLLYSLLTLCKRLVKNLGPTIEVKALLFSYIKDIPEHRDSLL